MSEPLIHLHKRYSGSWTVCGNDEVPSSETTERLSETTCPRCTFDGTPVDRNRDQDIEQAHAEAQTVNDTTTAVCKPKALNTPETKCPDCWAEPGDRHELSCPTVSFEEFTAAMNDEQKGAPQMSEPKWAEVAFRRIQADPTRCWGDVMGDLEPEDRRPVEVALLAERMAANEGVPVRDALHEINVSDGVKAQAAEWLCPENAADWQGTVRERMAAAEAASERARERMNDRVLARAENLHPAAQGLEAEQLRETAASVRDHRANAAWRAEHDLRRQEEQLLYDAHGLYAARDNHREAVKAFQAGKDWDSAALADLAARRANKEADDLVLRSIGCRAEADRQAQTAEELLAANARYDTEQRVRDETTGTGPVENW